MAVTRIRYKETKVKGVFQSVRNIHSKGNGAMYYVILNTNNCTYTIVNCLSKRKYSGGETINNITGLKRKIKQHLAEFGVDFGFEVRREKLIKEK